MGKNLKTFEEYKYFKVRKYSVMSPWPGGGEKDKNEPFFNKPKKEYMKIKRAFRGDADKVNDFIEIKKKLKENNIISNELPYYGEGWAGWDMNEFIHVIFRFFGDDQIIYSPLGASKISMRENIEIPKINNNGGRFNVDKIIETIVNFTKEKKKFDDEYNKNNNNNPSIDPLGEENWNPLKDKVDDEIRKEKEFWEWWED